MAGKNNLRICEKTFVLDLKKGIYHLQQWYKYIYIYMFVIKCKLMFHEKIYSKI